MDWWQVGSIIVSLLASAFGVGLYIGKLNSEMKTEVVKLAAALRQEMGSMQLAWVDKLDETIKELKKDIPPPEVRMTLNRHDDELKDIRRRVDEVEDKCR